MGLLVAGTKYRGEFEERLKKLMEEIKQNDNIILVSHTASRHRGVRCRLESAAVGHAKAGSPAKADTCAARKELCCCLGCPLDNMGLPFVPHSDVC